VQQTCGVANNVGGRRCVASVIRPKVGFGVAGFHANVEGCSLAIDARYDERALRFSNGARPSGRIAEAAVASSGNTDSSAFCPQTSEENPRVDSIR